jgi:hypothetical protein
MSYFDCYLTPVPVRTALDLKRWHARLVGASGA